MISRLSRWECVENHAGWPDYLFLPKKPFFSLAGLPGASLAGAAFSFLPFTALAFMSTLGLASLGAFSRPAVNEMPTGIPNWQFTTADARIKLKRLYPSTEEQWSTSPNR